MNSMALLLATGSSVILARILNMRSLPTNPLRFLFASTSGLVFHERTNLATSVMDLVVPLMSLTKIFTLRE